MTGKSDLIMFGSSYPHWNMVEASDLSRDPDRRAAAEILWKNADKLYGLGLPGHPGAGAS
jgi:predicted TIM-barrel fold metal-dependent hydrolase